MTTPTGFAAKATDVLLVASHGGHLAELFDLIAFDPTRMSLVTYDSPRTRAIANCTLLENIGTHPLRLMIATAKALRIFLRRRPRIVISTGAEIAIPFLCVARVFRTPTIYVESCTRILEPTLSARLLYHISTVFVVQSQELQRRFGPRAKYQGGLV